MHIVLLTFMALVSRTSVQAAPIESIPAGVDYLITVPGETFIDQLGQVIAFEGNPSDCGSACLNGSDMVVNRDAEVVSQDPDVPGSLEGTIQASITQLRWKSVGPVNLFGGGLFELFAKLDTSQPSTGTLFLTNLNGEGSSSTPEGDLFGPILGFFPQLSVFDFFLDFSCAPVGSITAPIPCGSSEVITFLDPNSFWNDPDDPGASGAFWAGRLHECTFFGDLCFAADPVAQSTTSAAPEPGSLALLAAAIAGCAIALRKKVSDV
jgi:hypothetical protein